MSNLNQEQALIDLHKLARFLASHSHQINEKAILQEIVNSARKATEADSVALHEYREDEQQFRQHIIAGETYVPDVGSEESEEIKRKLAVSKRLLESINQIGRSIAFNLWQ